MILSSWILPGLELKVASLQDIGSKHTLQNVVSLIGDAVDVKPEGYAVDKDYDDIIYVPEDAMFSIPKQSVSWSKGGKPQVRPSGSDGCHFFLCGV